MKITEIQLPVTYRVSTVFWIQSVALVAFVYCIILPTNINRIWKMLIPLYPFFLSVLVAFLTSMKITAEGFRYRSFYISSDVLWSQVERITIKWATNSRGQWKYLFVFLTTENKYVKIPFWSLSKNNLIEFICILREKAPNAGLDKTITEFLSKN